MALPNGYTPLEYIESTGSQYVDTGISDLIKFVADIQFTSTGARALMGYSTEAGQYFGINANNFLELGTSTLTVSGTKRNTVTFDVGASTTTLTADGTTISRSRTEAIVNTFKIFGGLTSYPCPGKIFSGEVYVGGTLVRDYIPVQRLDGAVGLLDKVNNVFYPDAAGGNFIPGPDVTWTELEYIESTGTQYVDTKFVPNQDARVTVDFEAAANASGHVAFFGARQGTSSSTFAVWLASGVVNPQYGSVAYNTKTLTLDYVKRLTYDFNKNIFAVGGQTATFATATFSAGATLCLLSVNTAGTVDSRMAAGKLYSCQIYDNGNQIQLLVPAMRTSGEVGLIDTLTGFFYGNSGTGVFIAGPVIVPPDPPEPPGPYEPPDYIARTQAYMATLREPFQKLCRLRFLQPDGSTAFSLDNNPKNRRSGAFIADGSIATNLQNGKRRTATVMLSNLDGSFDYNVNTVWFGTEIAIDEGVILPDGEEYYIQQGVFLIENPTESIRPGNRVATYNLVDKWANLDGTLFGNLESTYEVPSGTNIFQPINAILALDKGNGQSVDRVTPIYTEYYNSKSQALPDGSTASIINAPYTLRVDSDNGTYADVILGLAGMVNAWIGYDQTGALRIDPSQDDILDTNKPVLWQFSMDKVTFLGADYTVKNTEVYNDYIVIGELLDDNSQPAGRATNLDPRSDTNVQTIGRKTFRMSAPGFATDQQCQDLAVWKLKRSSALQKAITISCSQIFHIEENSLVSIVRTDKPGSPVERHLVMGFTRPLAATGEMQINAVSVQDFVTATVTSWPE